MVDLLCCAFIYESLKEADREANRKFELRQEQERIEREEQRKRQNEINYEIFKKKYLDK